MKHTPFDPVEPHDPISPRQAAQNPRSELAANVDRRRAVREALRQHPQAGIDEIVGELARRQIEVSATLVMQELARGSQTPAGD